MGYPDPFYVRFARDALGAWRELEDECGVDHVVSTGSVDFGDVDSVAAVVAAMDAEGVPSELLSPATARDRWPGMRFHGPIVFQPGGGRIASGAARLAMVEQAQRHGAGFCWNRAVLALEADTDRVRVVAGDDVIVADVAVVTAGAWISPLVADTFPLPPLTVTQESVFHFAPRTAPSWWPSIIHHDVTFVYGLETPGLGVKLAEHHTGPVVDAETRDGMVDPGSRERVVQFVEEWMPGLDPVPVDELTCLYTTTPTQDFVVDRRGPLVVGSPCSGHGFKFAPLVGAILADVAEHGDPPARFAATG
jgi:sarcosine oxidase